MRVFDWMVVVDCGAYRVCLDAIRGIDRGPVLLYLSCFAIGAGRVS